MYFGQVQILLKPIYIWYKIFLSILVFTCCIAFIADVTAGYRCLSVVIYLAFFLSIGLCLLPFLVHIILHTPGEQNTQVTGLKVNQYFTLYVATILLMLHPDDEQPTINQNIGNYSPKNTALHPKSLESSALQ